MIDGCNRVLAVRLQRSLRKSGCAVRAAPTGDEERVESVAEARGCAGPLWRWGSFTGTDHGGEFGEAATGLNQPEVVEHGDTSA
jgi:hypothetical protein